jgi:hypothetical protein
MKRLFGPLDVEGRVLPRQQTRVASFLVSAHGALARQFAFALPMKIDSAWHTELNAQFYREMEIVSLLLRATSWIPVFALFQMAATWETAWLPRPVRGLDSQSLAAAADLASRAHAIHAGIRPAALLPVEANADDPFVMALRRIEFESIRLLQAHTLLLKGPDLAPFAGSVTESLERRHTEIRKLWIDALEGVGIALAGNDHKP